MSAEKTEHLDDEAAWAAVLTRDPRADGRWVYAVQSTGIYCRPTCPSRRPARKNVSFFSTPRDAERAGFRSCKRCRPDAREGPLIAVCVDAARRYLEENLDRQIGLDALAKRVGLSPYHLQREFKARVGLSPKAYVRERRVERFKELSQRGTNVSEAIYEAGFGSARAFYEGASRDLGMAPQTYAKGGNTDIRYALGESSLGRLIVGVTDRGVCAVLLGEHAVALVKELAREFPRARLLPHPELEREVARVVDEVEGGTKRAGAPKLSLDLVGTDFQRRVWAALMAIPEGETRTYAEVAKALGTPSGARAVAAACAANKVAVLVPCHRVVRGTGELAGYRWGLAKKRRLLERERTRSSTA
ncbi:MAG: bifunctional DNA-binding transcriptional regulator/O6-methylguanine-DNA methyltransferase Ada [Polyangiaceae bacterium]